MSGFFQSLLARSRTDAGVVRPRIPSIFEAPHVADAAPLDEASVVEASTAPTQGAIERAVTPTVTAPRGESQARTDARPSGIEVQAVAQLPHVRQESSRTADAGATSAPPRQRGFESPAERIFSKVPVPVSSAREESPASPVTREIHATHHVHETIRDQTTLVNRTFLERVASAARQSLHARSAAQPAINAEPEIHVSDRAHRGARGKRCARGAQNTRGFTPVMGLDEYLRQKSKGAAQ